MTTILLRAERFLVIGFILIAALLLTLVPQAAFAASASIDEDALSSTSAKPTLSGSTSDLKSVRLVIENANGKEVFKKTVKVKKGAWKQRVTKSLPAGTYEVRLLDSSKKTAKTLETETLTIGKKGSQKATAQVNGTISVSSVPLFLSNTVAQGASAPIAYLKVHNSGKETVAIEGFELAQSGSASADSVIGFSTNDDKGGSRATIGGLATTKQFKNGKAYVPLAAAVAPGQVRIFTIKAILAKDASADLGKQLLIDVTGVRANGKVMGSFPVRGNGLLVTR